MTQITRPKKNWISFLHQYSNSEYLDHSYLKLYPDCIDARGIHYNLVWEDLRKANVQIAVFILSDIEEVLFHIKENLEGKAIIYLMNQFALEHTNEF